MGDELHARGEGAVACDMIAMVGADDHVLDGLRRQRLDAVDEPLRLCHAALAIGNDDAVGRDHDEAIRCERQVAFQITIQILIGIHIVGQLDHPRKIVLP